jgi:hypothetical protein
MVHIHGVSGGYLKHYHATGHDINVAGAAATLYLDAEQQSMQPTYGGSMAAHFGMTGAYDREQFLLAAEGKFRINGGEYVDVRYHASGKKAGDDGIKQFIDAAIEVVISPPKSWSIAVHLAKGDRKQELKRILNEAAKHAMNRMEQLVTVRVTRDGVTTSEKPLGIQHTNFPSLEYASWRP